MHCTKASSKRRGRRSALEEIACGPHPLPTQCPLNEASRSRRDKEKRAVTELSQLLPLSGPIRDQLDKSGVIRIAVAHIQLRRLLGSTMVTSLVPQQQTGWAGPSAVSAFHPVSCSSSSSSSDTELMKQFALNVFQTLSGFLVILDYMGKIVYVSETAAVHLGLSQVDMVGACLSSVVHVQDTEMAHLLLALGVKSHLMAVLDPEIRFTLRFKCALGRRNAGITVNGYKPIHFTGRIIANDDCRFMGYGQPLVAYGLNEVRLSSSMWMFRMDLSLKMVFVDSRVAALTGYRAGSLVDRSLYELVHVEDIEVLRAAHINVLRQHQSITAYYRLLANFGGWLWVRTKFSMVSAAALLPYPRQPQMVLGVSSAVSGVEQASLLVACIQNSPLLQSLGSEVLGEYSPHFYTQ